MNLDAIVDAIADRVAERVLQRLDRRATTTAPIVYTTHKNGPHLPGKTRRWMIEHISKLPGAHKVGRDWVIDATAYDAWLVAEDARRCVEAGKIVPIVKARPEPLSTSDEIAERARRSANAQGRRSR